MQGADKNLLLNYFNLRDQPFGVTPDPRYLFLTETHREALEGLLYGIHSGLGFIALTAEPGMGKTTLLRVALNRLGNTAKTVFLFQTITNPTELFRALLIDLGEKDPPGTLIDLEVRLNEILLRHNEGGRRVVVVLDEAQNLDDSVLEAIRMLSNFETSSHKLLQVILCGQHQLADRLATRELVQLRQRISIFATLKPLTRLQTGDYIKHRLKVAGYENSTPLFTPEAVSLIAHYSDGIPRNINNICFNSFSTGCASGKKVIDAEVVREVLVDLGLEGSKFADPTDDLGWQGETFDGPIVEPGLHEATFTGLIDDPGLHGETFAGPIDNPSLPEETFADPTDDLKWQGEAFAEPIDDPSLQGETTAEPIDDPALQEETFAESTDGPGWHGARLFRPVRDSEPDEDEFEESDLSGQREASPGLRVALIGAILFATALAVVGWNVARSGGSHSPLISQVTSWFHNSPPGNNQSHVQAPDDSSLQPAVPSETNPAKVATTQAPPVLQAPKPNHERSAATPRASRVTIPNGGVTVVGARQGQSVASICVEIFNGCTPALLNTIVELNPGIKDQDHLEAGQRVVLPVIPQQSN